MKFLNKKSIITSLVMVLILSLSFMFGSYLNTSNELAIRDVDVDSIGTLSYEEKVEQLKNFYNKYEIDTTNKNSISFTGYIELSDFDLSGFEFLSTNAETTIKKYKTDLDLINEKFYIVVQYIQDDKLINEEKYETSPYYDEYEDDYFIEMPDGSIVSLSQSLQSNNLENCSATLAIVAGLTAAEAAILLATVVVVAVPVIVQVVTTIISWVRSFWSWFRSLFTKTVTTTVSTSISYSLTLSYTDAKTKVEAIPYSNTRTFTPNRYYVAIADTHDGLLYVSTVPIDDLAALAILTTSRFVESAHKGDNKSFVVSLYTCSGVDAYLIASEAGTILGDPGAVHHTATKLGYFNHYHPGSTYTDLSHPHVFYGTPKA